MQKTRSGASWTHRWSRATSASTPERRNLITVGTIGVLRFALTGLRDLPGRKSLVLFSNGLPVHTDDVGNQSYNPDRGFTAFGLALPGLVNLANQGSVVVYTVDTRGLTTDLDFLGRGAAALGARGDPALGSRLLGQEGLSEFAAPTGGLFLHN